MGRMNKKNIYWKVKDVNQNILLEVKVFSGY